MRPSRWLGNASVVGCLNQCGGEDGVSSALWGARNCAQVTKEKQTPVRPHRAVCSHRLASPEVWGAGVSLMPGGQLRPCPSPDSMVEVAVRQPCWSWRVWGPGCRPHPPPAPGATVRGLPWQRRGGLRQVTGPWTQASSHVERGCPARCPRAQTTESWPWCGCDPQAPAPDQRRSSHHPRVCDQARDLHAHLAH